MVKSIERCSRRVRSKNRDRCERESRKVDMFKQDREGVSTVLGAGFGVIATFGHRKVDEVA